MSSENAKQLRLDLGKLKGTVSISGDVDKHPEYKLLVEDLQTLQSYEVVNRFGAFRALKKTLDSESKGLIETKFPGTFAKSSLGVKLSKKELDKRCAGLNTWIAECMSKLEQMNEKELELMSDFMDLKHLQVAGSTASRAAGNIQGAWKAKKEAEESKKKQSMMSNLMGRKVRQSNE